MANTSIGSLVMKMGTDENHELYETTKKKIYVANRQGYAEEN